MSFSFATLGSFARAGTRSASLALGVLLVTLTLLGMADLQGHSAAGNRPAKIAQSTSEECSVLLGASPPSLLTEHSVRLHP